MNNQVFQLLKMKIKYFLFEIKSIFNDIKAFTLHF